MRRLQVRGAAPQALIRQAWAALMKGLSGRSKPTPDGHGEDGPRHAHPKRPVSTTPLVGLEHVKKTNLGGTRAGSSSEGCDSKQLFLVLSTRKNLLCNRPF